MRKIDKHQWTAITIIYMALLMGTSLKPATSTETPPLIVQAIHNAFHVPAYALLTFFLVRTWKVYRVQTKVYVPVFGIAVFYGILIEILQGFSPGRTPSLLDVSLNAIGTLIVLFSFHKGYIKWQGSA